MTIMANDLKTRGVTILDEALKLDDEAIISVRGKSKYVVMDLEHYNYLRECKQCLFDRWNTRRCKEYQRAPALLS